MFSASKNHKQNPSLFGRVNINSGMATAILLVIGLLSFEMFNYSTTNVALNDVLGNQKFLTIPWATILAIAFCGIDFAGVARLFIPEADQVEHETWFLFGAWLLAATMNAILTWWGVSLAIAGTAHASTAIVDAKTITQVVPVFVAILVWVTRILLIGSFAQSGTRMFAAAKPAQFRNQAQNFAASKPSVPAYPAAHASSSYPQTAMRPTRPATSYQKSTYNRPEPEYVPEPSFTPMPHNPQPLSARSSQNNTQPRQL